MGVWPGNDEDDIVFRRDSAVPWSDGEDGWDKADDSWRRRRLP
jgi:hypothetical protein